MRWWRRLEGATSFALSQFDAGATAQNVNGLTGNGSTYTDTPQSNIGGRNAGGRTGTRSLAPLAGAPSRTGFNGPDPRLVAVAENYARENGFTLYRQSEYVTVDDDRGKRISDAYEAMPQAAGSGCGEPLPEGPHRHKTPPMVAQGYAEFVSVHRVDRILFETEANIAGLLPRHFYRPPGLCMAACR